MATSLLGGCGGSSGSGGGSSNPPKWGIKPPPSDCTPTALLVNPCRPWLGATAGAYTQVASDTKSQLEYHEQRIGRQLDVVRFSHSPTEIGTALPLDTGSKGVAERYFANRASTYLFVNWEPTVPWALSGGVDPIVNANIDRVANNIKAIAPTKIFMTLHPGPEDDVIAGASDCTVTTYRPGALGGTPAEYRQMWRNVRDRFDALSVTNVVWVMQYMNNNRWDCLVDDVYPGNDLVDWVMFNAYGSAAAPNYEANVQRFLDLLVQLNDDQMLSKPLGIAEWNISDVTSMQTVYGYYGQAQRALENGRFPALKAHMVFDNIGADGGENRILYSAVVNNQIDTTRQSAYASFANSDAFENP